jgi:predicted DNA-binding helix-hairpin-helix protein
VSECRKGFDTLHRSGQVDGLLLSSGIIKGSTTTQSKIIDTAEIIRHRYHYDGYLHLKIMPGVEYDQLYRIMQLADRVSVNLEAPSEQRLSAWLPRRSLRANCSQCYNWLSRSAATIPTRG